MRGNFSVYVLCLLYLVWSVSSHEICNSTRAIQVTLSFHEQPRVVQRGQGDAIWAFTPAAQDTAIVVTPSNSSIDPDMRLYILSPTTSCLPVFTSQEFGGEYMRIHPNLTKAFNVTQYFLHVNCRGKEGCEYHLAFSQLEDDWQELTAGQQHPGIAYHGVPSHFKFVCGKKCKEDMETGKKERITFSAWPRDATSTKHLLLLVRFGKPPMTADEHLNASRGWFSGEVASDDIKEGTYYITVIKRHGLVPIPFVVSVTLPHSIQWLKLGRPTFGVVKKNSASFYKFYVDSADTDIEVYLTKLDGDPDCAMSHEEVNQRPAHLTSQWRSATQGDDEIIVASDDPKRRLHPTGWFHIGVHSAEDATFSIIAFAEKHLRPAAEDIDQGKDGYVIEWTELWLGLPQAMGVQPGRPANFLFFSRLATSKIYVNVEALQGSMPDVCVHNCGPDPHRCPWLPIYLGETMRANPPEQAVSFCREGAIRGYSSERQVIVSQPCTDCWYAILVTSESNRSRFKIQLGQAGRAHPLVDGEPFKSNADAADSCPLFVYDLPQSIADARRKSNATLRLSVTPIYGNPTFEVMKDDEDSGVIFNSSSGGDTWRLALTDLRGDVVVSGAYFVKVCAAGPHHPQFRIQASWDQPLSSDTSTKLGFGMLRDGEAQMGSMPADKHDVYMYMPATSEENSSVRVSVSSMGGNCDLFVLAASAGTIDTFRDRLHAFIEDPAANADWKEVEKEAPEVLITPSDAKYVPLNSGVPYIFLLSSRDKSDVYYEVTASTLGKSGGIEELPTTGLPLRGQVKSKEYRRYSISIAEANQDVSVQLTAEVGDCDLYVGRTPGVSSEDFDWRSEELGSDSVYIDGMGQINQRHCDVKTINEKNNCVYYVAVKGVSPSAFTLLATVPSLPVPLPLSQIVKVTLPPGGAQYFLTPVDLLEMPTALEVACSGALNNVTIKVVPSAEAKHLYTREMPKADLSASFFAGVWSLDLAPERLKPFCKDNCTVLSMLKASSVQSVCALSLQESRPGRNASGLCQPLEAGAPSRGKLQGLALQGSTLCFSLRIPSDGDVVVNVSPLTDCHPRVQASQFGKKTLLQQHLQGFISDKMEVLAGLLTLEVSVEERGECQFDVRANILDKSEPSHLSQFHSTAITLGDSIFSSTTRTAFFSLSKQAAGSIGSAEVTVMSLAGEIQGDCSTIALPTYHSQQGKRDFLGEFTKALQPADSSRSFGVYACKFTSEACKSECQLFLRIRSRHPGRASDFVVTALDRNSARILYPSLPAISCLGSLCEHGSRRTERYQLFIRNPSAAATLRLSCQGQLRERKCSQVVLSADSRLSFPQNRAERAYIPRNRDMLDGTVQMELKAPSSRPGHCKVPCILHIEVELLPGEFQSVQYQLEAILKDKFSLLVDGGMPLHFVAHPGKPEYFLFDWRHAFASTLTLDFPYDTFDPENSLVRMYILDCDSQEPADAQAAPIPSAEDFSRMATLNSRWQLTALEAATGTSRDNRSQCLGVRIGVISNRLHPVSMDIRGFGWHPGTTLLLGESLEGFVDGSHAASYEVVSDEAKEFALDLEVCAGKVHLQTASPPDKGAGQFGHDFQDGFSNMKMPFESNRWIQVSPMNGEYARYVISAQAWKEIAWLDTGNGRSLRTEQRDTGIAVAWQAVHLEGKQGGEDPNVQYEVFYIRADLLQSNFDTACGMYLEHTLRHAKRIITHALNIEIQDFEPGTLYHVNVLARSLATGHLFAFQSSRLTGRLENEPAFDEGNYRSFILGPVLILVMVCFAWCHRHCTGQVNVNAMMRRIELPSWGSSPQHYRYLEGRTIGGYAQF